MLQRIWIVRSLIYQPLPPRKRKTAGSKHWQKSQVASRGRCKYMLMPNSVPGSLLPFALCKVASTWAGAKGGGSHAIASFKGSVPLGLRHALASDCKAPHGIVPQGRTKQLLSKFKKACAASIQKPD